ncbi:MAG: amidase family protein [Acidimicrobiales bacterium]
MTTDLALAPLGHLKGAVAERAVSSRELVELFLRRVDVVNPAINAVVTLNAEQALRAAERADELTSRGHSSGPLHGLPFTVKDAIATGGVRSTGGAVELASHVPAADAPAVARLRAAGAILLGKTNLPRWSGDIETFNPIFGTTNNPWDLSRIPGGSSGGSAAAVCAGLTSFDVGTDIAGSVRIPSHFCGVFGLKPTYGLVPQRGYLDHVGAGATDTDINVVGPIARHASDLDLLLSVLAGPSPDDEVAWEVELPRRRSNTFRIAVWFDEPTCSIDADYRSVLDGAAASLAAAGHEVDEARPPVSFEEQTALFWALVGAAAARSYPEETATALAGGHLEWLRNQSKRAALQRTWREWFEGYDVLLCPVSPTAALLHKQDPKLFVLRTMTVNGESRSYYDNVLWTGLTGVVGLPSAVAPVGSIDGLPVGVQVVAPWWHDREAVRAAGIVGDLTRGYVAPPIARTA